MLPESQVVELIGGEEPYDGSGCSYVAADYVGACSLSYWLRRDKKWAIFPSREISLSAGWAACKYNLGGYTDVAVHPLSAAPDGTPQYSSAEAWLFEGQDFIEEAPEEVGVRAIARRFMRELVKQIAASPWELAAIEWRDLERLLFEVFVALGFNATLTRSSKDGGYDLRLEAEGHVYFVEVKHWAKPKKVGAAIICRFADIVIKSGAEGLVLSTSGFTDQVMRARLEISQFPVVLGTDHKIISLCQCYVQSEAGLWIPERALREVFFQTVF